MKQPPKSLVLITVDCLRADHVGFLGYQRPTTPFLDTLAKTSFVFENAIAGGTPTYYALPAILASRFPLAHGRDVLGIAPGEETIATALKDCGWATAAFLAGNPYLSPRFGYEQGFDAFADCLGEATVAPDFVQPANVVRSRLNNALATACHSVPGLSAAYDELYFQYCQKIAVPKRDETLESLRRFPSAELIIDRTLAWLDENSRRPFFLWLHFMDPHAPYYPKSQALDEMRCSGVDGRKARYLNSYWARGDLNAARLQRHKNDLVTLYDAGVRWADTQIRRLTEKLVDLNVWNNCALAVTADHGEEFLDHGGRFHAPVKLTEELTRVPLLLHIPESTGSRLPQPFGLIDLAPTLLDVLDMAPPASFRGRSRWGKMNAGTNWHDPAITEAVRDCTNPFHVDNRTGARLVSVRQGQYKLVMDFAAQNDFLYDLVEDPKEQHALAPESMRAIRRELLGVARQHVAESYKSRDFDCRISSQLRELRLEWAHSSPSNPN